MLLIIFALLLALIMNEIFLQKTMIKNASAIIASGIGVYWDQNCTKSVASINWGVLSPGDSKTITLYIRNEEDVSLTITITATNWNPSNANKYLTLSCQQNNTCLKPQKTIEIQLTLQVSPNIRDIEGFNFDILFEGKEKIFLPTDVNKDGIVDLIDVTTVALAFGSKPGDPNWNENADINKNNVVNFADYALVINDFGKSS
ncbi:MAG: dockerin type I domain-containing protein [Candidatus Bathyarchaeia archaeon]